jgi:hypothetical protein
MAVKIQPECPRVVEVLAWVWVISRVVLFVVVYFCASSSLCPLLAILPLVFGSFFLAASCTCLLFVHSYDLRVGELFTATAMASTKPNAQRR